MAIEISISLTSDQAAAYRTWLAQQYNQAMADCWYSDIYRHTPEGQRGRKVLADHPHIAAICRTLRQIDALQKTNA